MRVHRDAPLHIVWLKYANSFFYSALGMNRYGWMHHTQRSFSANQPFRGRERQQNHQPQYDFNFLSLCNHYGE